MSKQKVTGFTIQIIPTYPDVKGYELCGTCNNQTALVYPVGEWNMDSEAYKDGEELADTDREEVHIGGVTGHWCEECEILVSLSYNF